MLRALADTRTEAPQAVCIEDAVSDRVLSRHENYQPY